MASEKARDDALQLVMEKMGMVPNLLRDMSVSPAATRAYVCAAEALGEGVFEPAEQHAIMLAASVKNNCHYCGPVHHTMAEARGVSDEDLRAITTGLPPQSRRLGALVRCTWLIMDKNGWLDSDDVARLHAEGIDQEQLYEIIGFIALKTFSNYVNHVNKTQLDPAFRRHAQTGSE